MSEQSRHVLLVEDNPDDELLTVRALRRHNLANAIRVARDGEEALALLHGPGSNPLPELVLLDLKLPKIDGLSVLSRIREHTTTRFLPVVVLTSSDEERDLGRSYERGCNAYVRKPIDFTEFVEAARLLGIFWLVMNRTPRGAA